MQDLIIKVEDKEFDVSFTNGNPNVAVNDIPYQVELLKSSGKNIYSFAVNNKICQIEFDFNEYAESQIIMDGIVFNIDISNETKKMIEKFIQAAGGGQNSGMNMIKAPMPGLVIKILVEEGQQITKGDKVIIVEAMKMENSLQSPVSGIVKSVLVREGQAVDKDAKMIEIDVS